jgi:hypothetical protein
MGNLFDKHPESDLLEKAKEIIQLCNKAAPKKAPGK